jgi:hypothetical protein
MARSVNLDQLAQTSFDSAIPSGSAIVAHPLTTAGDYVVSRLDGRSLVQSHSLTVLGVDSDEVAGRTVAASLQFVGTEVRAPAVKRTLEAHELERLDLREGGYASFTGAPGTAETARVQRVTAKGRASTVWESTKLVEGDVYALSIGRPGLYRVRNTVDDTEARLVVTYPKVGNKPYRPAAPVTVRCGEASIEPSEITLGPLQGLVVQIGAPARIVIDLVEPDDGPDREQPTGKAGERRPADGRRRVASFTAGC